MNILLHSCSVSRPYLTTGQVCLRTPALPAPPPPPLWPLVFFGEITHHCPFTSTLPFVLPYAPASRQAGSGVVAAAHKRPRAVTSNVPPSSGTPIQTRLGRPLNKEFDNGWGVLGPRQLFCESRLRIEKDPTRGRVLAPLQWGAPHIRICWKEARTDVPSRPGNRRFSHEGLARIGDSNGDCTDEKRLEWELVLACTPNRPLRGHRGRFGSLLKQLESGIFGRMAVVASRTVLCFSSTTLVRDARQSGAPGWPLLCRTRAPIGRTSREGQRCRSTRHAVVRRHVPNDSSTSRPYVVILPGVEGFVSPPRTGGLEGRRTAAEI